MLYAVLPLPRSHRGHSPSQEELHVKNYFWGLTALMTILGFRSLVILLIGTSGKRRHAWGRGRVVWLDALTTPTYTPIVMQSLAYFWALLCYTWLAEASDLMFQFGSVPSWTYQLTRCEELKLHVWNQECSCPGPSRISAVHETATIPQDVYSLLCCLEHSCWLSKALYS